MTKFTQPLLISGLIALSFVMATESEARSRRSRFFFWRPAYDYQYDPYAYEGRYEDPYEDESYRRPPRRVINREPYDRDPYADSYAYEDPAPPPRPVKKVKKAVAQPAKPPSSQTKPTTTTADTVPTSTSGVTEKSKSATGLSCERATDIVTSYGFSGVKPSSCEGKVYAFNATRGGKPFTIKVSATTGELTEVKKQ